MKRNFLSFFIINITSSVKAKYLETQKLLHDLNIFSIFFFIIIIKTKILTKIIFQFIIIELIYFNYFQLLSSFPYHKAL